MAGLIRGLRRGAGIRRQFGGETGPQLQPDAQHDLADIFPHDRVVRRHGATAPFAFKPDFVVDDLLDHDEFAENDRVKLGHGVGGGRPTLSAQSGGD